MGELRSFVSIASAVAATVAFGYAMWHATHEHYDASIACGVIALYMKGLADQEDDRG